MADLYLDNPAGRLHRILVVLRKTAPNIPIMQALASALDIKTPYLPVMTRAMGEFFLLPDQAQSEVQALDGGQSKDRLLQWYPKVMEALNCFLFQKTHPSPPIGNIAAIYGDGDLMALEFCSEALHLARAETVIRSNVLADIKECIIDLLGTLESDTQLDAELRDLLIWNARAMLHACDSYSRCGTVSIRDAYNQTVGSLVNNWNITVHHDSSPKTWEKVISVLSVVSAALSFGTAVITALEAPPEAPPAVVKVLPVIELSPGAAAGSGPAPLTKESDSKAAQ